MNRVSRQQVVRCASHRTIKQKMIETLKEEDGFSLAAILEETGFTLFAESIHWPHLRDIIAEETGRQLFPVAPAYFMPHDITDEYDNPGRYVAGGELRPTAGYVQYSSRTQHLAEYNLKRKRNMIKGSEIRYKEGCEQARTYIGSLDPLHELPLFRERNDDDEAA